MKEVFRVAAISAIVGLSSASAFAGPFGIQPGMTRNQVIALVGKDAVQEERPDGNGGIIVDLATVPKPYREFNSYTVIISPTEGVLKLIAFGAPVETSADGQQLQEHFASLKFLVTDTYSQANTCYDDVKPDSPWRDPQEFMMGLAKKDRTLECFWGTSSGDPLKNGVKGIDLEAVGVSRTKGFIVLIYEFPGYAEYLKRARAAERSVF